MASTFDNYVRPDPEEIYKVDPKRETAEYIFDFLFLVRVKKIDTISVEQIKIFGSPITFDKNIDRELRNESVQCYKSIAQLADMYAEGITFGIIDIKDTKRIYDFIIAHLDAWKKKIEHDFHCDRPPLNDLKLLYELGEKIYGHARPLYVGEATKETEIDKMFKHLNGSFSGFTNPFAPKPVIPDYKTKTKSEIARDEYFSIFQSKSINDSGRF